MSAYTCKKTTTYKCTAGEQFCDCWFCTNVLGLFCFRFVTLPPSTLRQVLLSKSVQLLNTFRWLLNCPCFHDLAPKHFAQSQKSVEPKPKRVQLWSAFGKPHIAPYVRHSNCLHSFIALPTPTSSSRRSMVQCPGLCARRLYLKLLNTLALPRRQPLVMVALLSVNKET